MEEVVELVCAEDSAEFGEAKERDEDAEDDDGFGGEIAVVDFVQDGAEGLVVDDAFDELLEEVEGEDEEAKEDCLVEDSLVKRAAFGAAAEVGHLADENDLGDDESVDDGEGVTEVVGVVLSQQQHAVCGEGAKRRTR